MALFMSIVTSTAEKFRKIVKKNQDNSIARNINFVVIIKSFIFRRMSWDLKLKNYFLTYFLQIKKEK